MIKIGNYKNKLDLLRNKFAGSVGEIHLLKFVNGVPFIFGVKTDAEAEYTIILYSEEANKNQTGDNLIAISYGNNIFVSDKLKDNSDELINLCLDEIIDRLRV